MLKPEDVPAGLRAVPRWSPWKLVKTKEVAKGFSPNSGEKAAPEDPNCWLPFDRALYLANAHKLDGVGLLLVPNDDLVVVSIDRCRDAGTGRLEVKAQAA